MLHRPETTVDLRTNFALTGADSYQFRPIFADFSNGGNGQKTLQNTVFAVFLAEKSRHIVGHDEDDVRWPFRRIGRAEVRQCRQEQT